MKKRLFFWGMVASFGLVWSCEKPTENAETETSGSAAKPGTCTIDTLAAKSLESEYGCTNTKYQTTVKLRDTFALVSTTAQFDSLVGGGCKPAVDFSRYDLWIGKKQLTSGNQRIAYQIVRHCPSNTMNIEVMFFQDATMIAPNLTYHALLPKLRPQEKVVATYIVK